MLNIEKTNIFLTFMELPCSHLEIARQAAKSLNFPWYLKGHYHGNLDNLQESQTHNFFTKRQDLTTAELTKDILLQEKKETKCHSFQIHTQKLPGLELDLIISNGETSTPLCKASLTSVGSALCPMCVCVSLSLPSSSLVPTSCPQGT